MGERYVSRQVVRDLGVGGHKVLLGHLVVGRDRFGWFLGRGSSQTLVVVVVVCHDICVSWHMISFSPALASTSKQYWISIFPGNAKKSALYVVVVAVVVVFAAVVVSLL